MVYAVPLTDGSLGIAQAGEAQGEMLNVIYVALFSDRHSCVPDEPPPLKREDSIALVATWRQGLNRGDWLTVGHAPEVFRTPEFPNERYAKNGYVGAQHQDTGLLSNFLSAYHGLIPWNVMHDPELL